MNIQEKPVLFFDKWSIYNNIEVFKIFPPAKYLSPLLDSLKIEIYS